MFRLLGLLPTADFHVVAAAALAGVPAGEAARLLDRLTAGFLLTNPAAGRYTFHDLLRWYAAEHAAREPDGPEAFQRLCDWYLHSVDAAAQHLHRHALRLPMAPEVPPAGVLRFDTGATARHWLEAEQTNLVALIGHCAEHGPRRTAFLLADALRGVFDRFRHIVDWTATAAAGLAAARRDNDTRAIVAMLHSAAHALYTVCRYPAAIANLTEAAELARGDGWELGEALVTSNLGIIHGDLGRPIPGAQAVKRAMLLGDRLALPMVLANKANNLSYIQARMGQLRKAARCGERSLEAAARGGNLSGQASTRHTLGCVYWDLGRPDLAVEHFKIALDVAREVGYREVEIRVNLRMALLDTVHDGGPGDGLARADAGLAEAREIKDSNIEVEALTIGAAIRLHLGDLSAALWLYERAADVADKIGLRPYIAEPLLGVAAVHRRLGDLDRARSYAQKAYSEASEMFLMVFVGQALAELAEIELRRGDRTAAAAYARRARRVSIRTGHRPGEDHARAVLNAAR
jgi:tetratricopeptide (TPR) repeat protein